MLLSLLELASNKALEHDADSQQRFEKLQGKSMTLRVKPLNQAITLTPTPQRLAFSSGAQEGVDVTLTVTVSAMIKITRDGFDNADLESDEMQMVGNPLIGQRFAQAIADLDVDWESLLSEHIGEGPARTATSIASQTAEFAEESRSKLHAFVGKLIEEELELVVDSTDVSDFVHAVDELSNTANKLEAQLETLRNKYTNR